jgi:N-carbamoylputrescine amidase
MKNIKFALLQLTCSENVQANQAKTVAKIREAAAQGAQVICLQELYRSVYFCHKQDAAYFDLAEVIPGPGTDSLLALAQELKVVIVASLFEKRSKGVYHNTCAVLDYAKGYLGKYRKMHIPQDAGYEEKYYFTPGDLGYQVFDSSYGKLGILICWDQWYPEAARLTALKGAEVLIYPTAIGWDNQEPSSEINREQYQAWQTVQRGHAVANEVPVIAVNRVGEENGQTFWGGSFVSNAFGRVLYQAPHNTEEVAIIEIDLDIQEQYRRIWPFMRDRRIDSYQDIIKRFID